MHLEIWLCLYACAVSGYRARPVCVWGNYPLPLHRSPYPRPPYPRPRPPYPRPPYPRPPPLQVSKALTTRQSDRQALLSIMHSSVNGQVVTDEQLNVSIR